MQNSQRYIAHTVPGTEKFVVEEIVEKFGKDIEINGRKKGIVEFSWLGEVTKSEHENLLVFKEVKGATHIAVAENESHRIKTEARAWRIEKAGSGGINPSLAYILCRIAGIQKKDTVCDPFCGSGTIAITALKYFQPKKALISDLSGNAINQTQINLNAAQIRKQRYALFRSNISMLRLGKNSVSKVITNPPFGIKVGKHEKNINLYEQLLAKSKNFLKENGKIILLTTEKQLLLELANKHGFKVSEVANIETSGLYPSIFQLVRS